MTEKQHLRLQSWIQSVVKTERSWEANYMYVTDVTNDMNYLRDRWLSFSIEMLEWTIRNLQQTRRTLDLLPLLIIPLEEVGVGQKYIPLKPDSLTRDWLLYEMDRSSPPSIHCCSVECFGEYYERELEFIPIADTCLAEYPTLRDCRVGVHVQYDEAEGEYNRTLNIFAGFPRYEV